MFLHRPFEQKHTLAKAAWDKVIEAVNSASTNVHPLGSTAIRNYIAAARKESRQKQREDRIASGTNDSETTLENRVRSLDELMSQAEQKKDADDIESSKFRIEKRRQQAAQVTNSLCGLTPAKKARKSNPVNYMKIISEQNQSEVVNDDVYQVDSSSHSLKAGPSKGKNRAYMEEVIDKRREALDRDFSAALSSAEKERNINREILNSIQKNQQSLLDEMKSFASESLAIQREIARENKKMLKESIENQQRFFEQMQQLLLQNMASSSANPRPYM